MPDRPTVAALVGEVAAILRDAGIDDARAEARLIVAHATGLDRTAQLGHANSVRSFARLNR